MLSIKLHEATKEFKISNKLAMFFLEKQGIPVKSHSSVINMEQLELLREFSGNKDKYSAIISDFNRIEREKKKKTKAKTKEKPPAKEKKTGRAKEKPEKPQAPPQAPQKQKPPKKEQPHTQANKDKDHVAEKKPPKTQASPPPSPPKRQPQPTPPAPKKTKPAPPSQPSPPPKPTPSRPTPKSASEKEYTKHKPSKTPPRPSKAKRDLERDEEKPKRHKPKIKEDLRDIENYKESGKFKSPPHPHRPPKSKKRDKFKPKWKERNRVFDAKAKPQEPIKKPQQPEKKKPKVFNLPDLIQTSDFINIKELAEKLNLRLKDIDEKMGALKKEYVPNHILEEEEIKEICSNFGVEVDIVSYEDELFFNHIEKAKAEKSPRPPVVTVMGHVDHGKTTLLDTLRNTRVAAKEAGGITQKIGAYQLNFNNNEIVFIDTPGHEAFTNIRARGARITDVVVLVVAANDGVQPQTIEAVNHARAAGVPLVVAINKIDLEGANPNRVKEELTRQNIIVEDWGGEVVSVEISAKKNKNLDTLLEMISLVSEMLELKAYKDIPARGTIIESHLDPKLGPLGTVLIQHGNLRWGDFFICGNSVGKVKSIFDHRGKTLQKAAVPQPVEIMGFDEVPEAGELFQVTDDIEKAKKVVSLRKQRDKENRQDEAFSDKKISLQNLFQKLEENKSKVISIIIKTDNYSSSEVLEKILLNQSKDELKINILQNVIGNITESDVLLASTSGAMIVGFNVKASQTVLALAKREQVEIKLYNVIYHLIEDIEKAIKGEIEPEYIENYIGTAEVLQTFKVSKIGIIAGCIIKEGKVTRKSKIKVLRKKDLVFEGDIENLKRVKDDVSEVNAGTECGIRIRNFNAVEPGDILEIYEEKLKT